MVLDEEDQDDDSDSEGYSLSEPSIETEKTKKGKIDKNLKFETREERE